MNDPNLDYFHREELFDDSNPDYDTPEQSEERELTERKYGVRRDFTCGGDPVDRDLPDGSE